MRRQKGTNMHNRIREALETPRNTFLGRVSRAGIFLAAVVLGGAALIAAPGASADPAFSETVPITYGGFNSCTGEAFSGTGTVHFVMSDRLSTGGALQHHLLTTVDGLQAVTPMGKRYVVQDTYSDEFVFSGASEETFAITAHFIRQGEDGTFVLGDDFYEYIRTHITANANGDVTALSVRTNDMTCQ
jgi:hypothetical protein